LKNPGKPEGVFSVTLIFMIIGIDASRANKKIKTGVEWYSWHIIQELKKLTANDGNTWVLYTREPLEDLLRDLPENWYEVRAGWPPRKMWTQVRMAYEMWRRPADVLFVPGHVLPTVRPERSVVTIHDVGFRRFPRLYKQADIKYHEVTTAHIAKTEARIVSPSEFTGRELIDLYRIDASRIAITPLGVEHKRYRPIEHGSVVDVLTKYHVPEPYFLSVGRVEAKKNFLNLVKAWNAFKTRRGVGDPAHLVIAGTPGFQYHVIKKEIDASPFRSQIIELGYVPEEDLPYLMNGASALVHVSWYEGFGLPPVEAMACGTPVIASQVASLPEVIGAGNALFVSPANADDIAQAMERILDNPDLRASLGQKGRERASMYTWRRTAELTLPVLTEWAGYAR
jgi:glycosyltransferase involved in cell wall biosynthesis